MKQFFLVAGIASLVLSACGSESTTTDSTNTTTTSDSTYISPAPDTTNNALPPVIQDTAKTTSTNQVPPVSLPLPAVVKSQAAPSNVALNPEHGKPGHRCDIAVGAPLNSAAGLTPGATPSVTATPTVTASPTQTTITPTQPAGTKPKLNPPHGQPFHDCAIEVGKPLKS